MIKKLCNRTDVVNLYSDDGSEYNQTYEQGDYGLGWTYWTSLIECGLLLIYWSQAIKLAVCDINRNPCRLLSSKKTPFEMLTGWVPDFTNFRVYLKTLSVPKLEPKSKKCIFVEYAPNGYKLLNLRNKRIIIESAM